LSSTYQGESGERLFPEEVETAEDGRVVDQAGRPVTAGRHEKMANRKGMSSASTPSSILMGLTRHGFIYCPTARRNVISNGLNRDRGDLALCQSVVADGE
jgi:hypothetical protein